MQATEDVAYYAFALSFTGVARAEIRAQMLDRLAAAVDVAATERARCRDVDVAAAVRVRAW